jgi:hypothetical protein
MPANRERQDGDPSQSGLDRLMTALGFPSAEKQVPVSDEVIQSFLSDFPLLKKEISYSFWRNLFSYWVNLDRSAQTFATNSNSTAFPIEVSKSSAYDDLHKFPSENLHKPVSIMAKVFFTSNWQALSLFINKLFDVYYKKSDRSESIDHTIQDEIKVMLEILFARFGLMSGVDSGPFSDLNLFSDQGKATYCADVELSVRPVISPEDEGPTAVLIDYLSLAAKDYTSHSYRSESSKPIFVIKKKEISSGEQQFDEVSQRVSDEGAKHALTDITFAAIRKIDNLGILRMFRKFNYDREGSKLEFSVLGVKQNQDTNGLLPRHPLAFYSHQLALQIREMFSEIEKAGFTIELQPKAEDNDEL